MPSVLKNAVKKYGYNIGFKTDNQLEKHFKKKNHTNNNFLDRTGVYKISCDSCDKIYIGQTGRSFRKRFNDHISKTQNINSTQQLEKVNTKYGLHLINNNHDYTDDKINNIHKNLKPIYFCNKGKFLDTLEEFEIYKNTQINANKLINDKLLNKKNVLFDKIIKKHVI